MSNDNIAIEVEGLWKRYGLPSIMPPWLRRLTGRPAKNENAIPWALKDVNFQVKRGETLGILGRNGAGKSTLLKLLAGIIRPTRGTVNTYGSLFSMIELNAGINPDLTGRENVYTLGAVMGLTRNQMTRKIPDIKEFCELGEWFDQPVRKYSSGMQARLGFGVAVHVDADILLIDEVLAVGDLAFQRKCLTHMEHLVASESMTIILVSHSPYMIERICDRAMLLDDGNVIETRKPSDIIPAYFDLLRAKKPNSFATDQIPEDQREGTGNLRITRVEVLNADGQPADTVYTGELVIFRLYYRTKIPVIEPNFGIRIFNDNNTLTLSLASTLAKAGTRFDGEGYFDCELEQLPLMPNNYTIQVKSTDGILLDMFNEAATFQVKATKDIFTNTGNMGIAYAAPFWTYHPSQIDQERKEKISDDPMIGEAASKI